MSCEASAEQDAGDFAVCPRREAEFHRARRPSRFER
jgi:hypothetical protein